MREDGIAPCPVYTAVAEVETLTDICLLPTEVERNPCPAVGMISSRLELRGLRQEPLLVMVDAALQRCLLEVRILLVPLAKKDQVTRRRHHFHKAACRRRQLGHSCVDLCLSAGQLGPRTYNLGAYKATERSNTAH